MDGNGETDQDGDPHTDPDEDPYPNQDENRTTIKINNSDMDPDPEW